MSKGRVAEFFNRVDLDDPADSAIILVPLSASGTESEAQDYDTLADVLAGTANEQTGGGWVRKVLTNTEMTAQAADDPNNRFPATLPSVTWTAPTVGSNTTGLLVCYDSAVAGGTDANIIPICHNDFVVTADGNDVVLQAGAAVHAS